MPKKLSSFVISAAACIVLFLVCPVHAENECTAMEKEAEAIEGVVPSFDETGKFKSISMYADSSFIAPKRSLISAARKQAELKAKREFSNFIKEKVTSGTLSEYLMETKSVTNDKGETSGSAEEINRISDVIGSNTESVLSGIIKLDECVNTDEKYLIVRMGWKPSLSNTASAVSTAIQTSSQESITNNHNETNPGRNNDPNEGSNSSSGVKIITVVVEGRGIDANDAIRVGLRQAVSQIFGEQFKSEIELNQTTQTIEISGPISEGLAVETSSQYEKSNSKTKGTIQSYEIISKKSVSNAVIVSLRVNLAKYESGIDRNKKSIIVLKPKIREQNKVSEVNTMEFAKRIQSTLESKLTSSGKYNMLDREYLRDTMNELNFIVSSNGNVEEMARLGNQAGADLIVVTEILSFSPEVTVRTVGNKKITRGLLNAEVSIKLLDPATTKILISENFTFRNQKVTRPDLSEYSQKVATRISGRILRSPSGKGFSLAESDDGQRKAAAREANSKFKALEDKNESNW